ncbi:tetratricopeptide repeat protein [Streptomyces sp. NPDC020681]|uniref:caspase, EACC1-associated type n=1 Tax=Streptomyces sp. NPDC020681 TaxID=3365083 RepID=UPI0037B1E320
MTRPDPGASRAVLIGAHEFADTTLGALPGVKNNIEELRRLLTDPGLLGLDDAHCAAHLDPDSPVDVLARLHRAADDATDTLIVYYAGHGLIDPGDERQLYLATPGTRANGQWFLSLRYADIRSSVRQSPARRKVVILDCCFSAVAIAGGMSGSSAVAPQPEDLEAEGVCVLTAASETATALCPPGETYSAFTGELVDLLEHGIAQERSELLTVGALYRQLHSRLSAKNRPLPQLGTRNTGSDIVLARNRAYVPVPAAVSVAEPVAEPVTAPDAATTAPRPAGPDTLAAPDATFVGREQELARIGRLAERTLAGGRPMVCLVHGMGGVGKTQILRRAAATWADRFQDGRFEVNLRGFAPGPAPGDGRRAEEARDPYEVLESLLRQAGRTDIPADRSEREERWRDWLSGRRVLLLLDNAHDAAQIRPLLPGPNAMCLTLVSSREQQMPADESVPAELLPPADAVELLRSVAGAAETAFDDSALEALAERCGRLPVALRPIGWSLRHTPVSDLLATMDASHPLRELPDADGPVQAAFLASYLRLPAALQLTLRHCAMHPGPDFAGDTIAAMMGVPPATAGLRLGQLRRRHVLLGAHGRFTFHGLFRHYATAVAEADPELRGPEVRHGLYAHLLGSLAHGLTALTGAAGGREHADGAEFPSADEARKWLTSHSAELELAAAAAADDGWEHAARLASGAGYWLYLNERYGSARSHYERALQLARTAGDRASQAYALNGIAETHRLQFHFADARENYGQALALSAADRTARSESLNGIALSYIVEQRYADARASYEEALELARRAADPVAEVYALTGIGDTHRYEFRDDESVAWFEEAARLAGRTGNRSAQAYALTCIGHAHRNQRRYDEAHECYNRAIELAVAAGDRMAQAQAHDGIARTYAFQGRYKQARDQCVLAMWTFDALGVQDWVDQCVELLRDLKADERRQ